MSKPESIFQSVWWNTGLRPRGSIRPQPEESQSRLIAQTLKLLVDQNRVDCFVLGETTREVAEEIRSSAGIDYRLESVEQGNVNISVLYEPARLLLLDSRILPITYVEKTLIRSVRWTFALKDELWFHLFACHWPSRLQGEQARRERIELAAGLRRHLQELQGTLEELPAIFVGDFNDEPFDESVSAWLQTSRDLKRVSKKPSLLYNPFWSHLGEDAGTADALLRRPPGTHYFASDQLSEWFTFDQGLVSSEFILHNDWQLDEPNTGILALPHLIRPTERRIEKTMDHFPILLTLKRRSAPLPQEPT